MDDEAFEVSIYNYIGVTFENWVGRFVDSTVDQIIVEIGPLILQGVYLYTAVTICRAVFGFSGRPAGELLMLVIRVAVVSALALSADTYQEHIVGFFESIESGLIGVFSAAGDGVDMDVYTVLDGALGSGLTMAADAFDRARESGWMSGEKGAWYLTGLLLFAASILSTIVGAVIALGAKLAVAILIAVGPLFIACLMFPVLGRFFELFAAQFFQHVLTSAVVVVILTMTVALYTGYIADFDIAADDIHPIVTAGLVAVVAFISYKALAQAPSIAAGLGGGLSLAGATAREVFAPALGAVGGMSGLASLANFKLTRRDMQSGRMTRMPWWRHVAAGNTRALNPAYRSYIKEHASHGWGKSPGGGVKPRN